MLSRTGQLASVEEGGRSQAPHPAVVLPSSHFHHQSVGPRDQVHQTMVRVAVAMQVQALFHLQQEALRPELVPDSNRDHLRPMVHGGH